MTFLNPILLYAGLACIAVPIIVHLLTRRRRKPVLWAAMRFLLEAYRKHRRRLTLEQLLLLAARCLLVALVGVALGKPVLGAAGFLGTGGPRTVYLLIDNSLSASAVAEDGSSALERHKVTGARLLAGLDQSRGDRAGLMALGGPAEALVVPPSNDLAGVGRALEALTATDSRADLPGALSRLNADLEAVEAGRASEAGRATVALLSEWRAGSADLERALPALAAGAPGQRPWIVAAPPVQAPADNIAIVKAEPLRALLLPGAGAEEEGGAAADSSQARVTLRRFGPSIGSAATTLVGLRIDRVEAGATPGAPTRASVRWAPGQEEATVPLAVELPSGAGGPLALVAEIDRDTIAGDNIYRRPIEARPAVQVGLLIAPGAAGSGTIERFRPADWLRLALQPQGVDARAGAGVRVIDVDPRAVGQVGVLSGLDAVLLPAPELVDAAGWSRIGEFCRAGGLVIVFPSAEATVHLWADSLTASLGLDWTIAREARTYTPPAELAEETGTSDLLVLLSGELGELVKPVRVSRALPLESSGRDAEVLLRLKDSTPLAVAGAPGPAGAGEKTPAPRGLVVFIAAAPDLRWGDLPTKPLMLPLMQEIVRQGVGRARGVWTALAGSLPGVPAGTVELRAIAGGSGADAGAESVWLSGTTAPAIRRAGLWRATDARGATLGLAATNADIGASRTAPRSTGELTPWLGALAGEDRLSWLPDPGEGAQGSAGAGMLGEDPRPPISPILLACAAAVALLELGLARWFSHASIDRAVQVTAPGARA